MGSDAAALCSEVSTTLKSKAPALLLDVSNADLPENRLGGPENLCTLSGPASPAAPLYLDTSQLATMGGVSRHTLRAIVLATGHQASDLHAAWVAGFGPGHLVPDPKGAQ